MPDRTHGFLFLHLKTCGLMLGSGSCSHSTAHSAQPSLILLYPFPYTQLTQQWDVVKRFILTLVPGAQAPIPHRGAFAQAAFHGAVLSDSHESTALPPDPSPSDPPPVPSSSSAPSGSRPTTWVHLEEVEDEGDDVPFPSEQCAGKTFGHGASDFECRRKEQEVAGEQLFAPFRDINKAQLATFLVSSKMSQKSIDQFLCLRITHN
ncbi:hypothetical protein BOTBODRAFT_182256 [Botryobasidium botryosum FD-172 SS1]|uniref:Uncharacterized protein n=1 Tax=Botryobasidium botryosum (strain FD-172 SS1) TaxID=930990 RepID=A0A067LRB0_BOTB1|nr:hypothetical protein BOTBODRAFT_182256 [Botryobasidium botryosum FD-172 SS1]